MSMGIKLGKLLLPLAAWLWDLIALKKRRRLSKPVNQARIAKSELRAASEANFNARQPTAKVSIYSKEAMVNIDRWYSKDWRAVVGNTPKRLAYDHTKIIK